MRLLFICSLLLLSCTASAPVDGSLNRFQTEFLNEINKIRKKGCKCGNSYMPSVNALLWNAKLKNSAGNHARDMAQKRYFDHVSLSGKSIKVRIQEAGYTLKGMRSYAFGENIAAGQASIKNVMNGWLNSEGHWKNIMNPRFREVGVAEYDRYWVQDFGMRNPY